MKLIQTIISPVKNESGFALISTLLIMSLLTITGLAAINTTSFELKIAGNERRAHQRFYSADSGWKQAGPYLNAQATPPSFVNTTLKAGDSSYDWDDIYYNIVRNFGDGGDKTTNAAFSTGTEDGRISNIPYWYRLAYQNDFPAIGFGAGYRDFQYEVKCNSNGTSEVVTGVRKVYRVGY
ncbi:pilus assembly PilX family protein [Desulfospira joergensenii]|uniref:pilus assembly PilX family protein n=1 Tax=Desulfospira joergensenii TaxID=53329 RepID=UPI0003B31527|nr:pilus assembly PilX N-terminal domain-containing protein [Desulfospira joergensenii]